MEFCRSESNLGQYMHAIVISTLVGGATKQTFMMLFRGVMFLPAILTNTHTDTHGWRQNALPWPSLLLF